VHGGLKNQELFWRNHFRWLESIGYRLRRRYEPGWVPSWTGTTKSFYRCEDGQPLDYSRVADAVRIADGADVALKQVIASEYPYEVDIATYLSSDPLSSEPRNHSVPVYDVIQVPDEKDMSLVVMPLLRKYDSPRFDTFGEAVEFLRQMFEGLQFLHQQHIAHRDCWGNNMMMEGKHIYPDGFHPVEKSRKRDYSGRAKHFTRTQRPPKYYLIDFGLSRRFSPDDRDPGARPIMGGDKSVPEIVNYQSGTLNPFHTDIYYIGNMVRTDFIMVCKFPCSDLVIVI
jgi:serine/threonine protein kinase